MTKTSPRDIVVPARGILVGFPTILALVGLGALLLLFSLRAFHERNLAVDDAYILARYASQFADGHGFRWNATSPPSEGFTSILFVVLQAGLLRMGFEPPAASALLSIGAVAGVVALLVSVADPRRPGFAIAALPAAFLLLDTGIGVHASRGLETSMFFVVAVGMVALTGMVVERPHPKTGYAMALVSFLLVLTRPDGALIVAICWMAAALGLRRRTDRNALLLPGAALLTVIGVAFAAWKFWYFGDTLPTAYYVKAAGVGWAGGQDVNAFVADYRAWLVGAGVACFTTSAIRFGGGPGPGLWRRPYVEAVLAVAIGVPWLIYAARIVHETGFVHRFSFVLVPLSALAITRGLRAALDVAAGRLSGPGAVTVVGLLATVTFALAMAGPFSRSVEALTNDPPSDAHVVVFSRLGRAIASAGLGEQISFLNGAAGAAPYFAGARHVDAFGLATTDFSKPMSAERRQQLIAEGAFDIIEMPFLPASAGANSVANEPLRHSDYWRDVEAVGLTFLRFKKMRTMEEWFQMAHWVMRYLRDHMTLAGAARLPGARMIVYVSRASPHYERLIETLSRELDIRPSQVR